MLNAQRFLNQNTYHHMSYVFNLFIKLFVFLGEKNQFEKQLSLIKMSLTSTEKSKIILVHPPQIICAIYL